METENKHESVIEQPERMGAVALTLLVDELFDRTDAVTHEILSRILEQTHENL